MLTIFTIPKSFRDKHISIIQQNAIKSWMTLGKDAEIIIFGDDEGVAATAEQYGLKHLSLKTNEFNTPLLSDAFHQISLQAKNDIVCYINSDIILFPEFLEKIKCLPTNNFLAAGERWDLEITNQISFEKGWIELLNKERQNRGQKHIPNGSDFFIFRKGDFSSIPDFAVGRVGWDNWMIAEANRLNYQTIDVSSEIIIIHQNHDYKHLFIDKNDKFDSTEAQKNYELANYNFERLEDMKYCLTGKGVKKIYLNRRKIKKLYTKYFK